MTRSNMAIGLITCFYTRIHNILVLNLNHIMIYFKTKHIWKPTNKCRIL